jgi:hypothetical protein
MTSTDWVLHALRDPGALLDRDAAAWDLFVRQARSADLLGRVAWGLHARGELEAVPPAPRSHLTSALALAEAQHAEVRREIDHVVDALAPLGVRPVLLKGAAYVAASLACAAGRTFSDVDILVPRERLAEVEAALMAHGWTSTHKSAYDQRYYREWMHELPPLQHVRRSTTLDVHHAILPITAKARMDPRLLLASARPLGSVAASVLSPVDMVLHSMAHLLHNEDMTRALRDLSDLDLLLRTAATDRDFWVQLVDRAKTLDLTRSLYYGLHRLHAILGTPVPEECLDQVRRCGAPPQPLRRFMNALWDHAFRSPHASTRSNTTPLALAALYLRAHWLRMPPALLLRHTVIKVFGPRD